MRELVSTALLLLVLVASLFFLGWSMRGTYEARRADLEMQEVLNAHREQTLRLHEVLQRADDVLLQQRRYHDGLRQRLDAWLALPGVDCAVDGAGIELWNAANAGPDAGAAGRRTSLRSRSVSAGDPLLQMGGLGADRRGVPVAGEDGGGFGQGQ